MKRVIALFLICSLFYNYFSSCVFAAELLGETQKKIAVYLKPDITVELNSEKLIFRDPKGNIVYPIVYNGSTYLPVRSISELMNEPVEWDSASKTVFIGKTLSNPNKAVYHTQYTNLPAEGAASMLINPAMVNAYLKPDVLIMYDFVVQAFRDIRGNLVYPIIYNSTTYLPIRAISQLMKEPIEWDGTTKTIQIGDGKEQQMEEITKDTESGINTKNLKSLFERVEILYYEATAKTTSLKQTVTTEEKHIIAAAISENYISSQNLSSEIKTTDRSNFSEDETAAYDKIEAFAESTEYYILVLENIAYLAAQDADYTMLADTFLYFAMDSQTKMEEARVLIH